jgi:hypothetical protein
MLRSERVASRMEGVGFHFDRNALFQCYICLHPACVDRFRSVCHRVCKRCRSRSSCTGVHSGRPRQGSVATSVSPVEWRSPWNGHWVSLLAVLRSADRSGDPRVCCGCDSPVDDGLFWSNDWPRTGVAGILDFRDSSPQKSQSLFKTYE